MSRKENTVRVAAAGKSDVGIVRRNNEDYFLLADLTAAVEVTTAEPLNHVIGKRGCLYVVADGMGGAAAGEVASRLAAHEVTRALQADGCTGWNAFAMALQDSVHRANALVHEESLRQPRFKGMGTTLTAAGVYGDRLVFAHVGDSRAYLIRNRTIAQMTRDQSLVAHLVASGALTAEQAKIHPQRNVLLQALGCEAKIDVILSRAELRQGDRLILCSDGLSGKVEDEELRQIVEQSSDPRSACDRMIALARERGGEDNITAIVADFRGEGLASAPPGEAPAYREFTAADIGRQAG